MHYTFLVKQIDPIVAGTGAEPGLMVVVSSILFLALLWFLMWLSRLARTHELKDIAISLPLDGPTNTWRAGHACSSWWALAAGQALTGGPG